CASVTMSAPPVQPTAQPRRIASAPRRIWRSYPVVLGSGGMRGLVIVIAVIAVALGCTKGAKEGEEEARREAERIQKEKEQTGGVAKTIRPPVPGQTKIPCAQLLPDLAKFQE